MLTPKIYLDFNSTAGKKLPLFPDAWMFQLREPRTLRVFRERPLELRPPGMSRRKSLILVVWQCAVSAKCAKLASSSVTGDA
jgi:hypothetical protein